MFSSLKSKVITSFFVFIIFPVLIGAALILTQVRSAQQNQIKLIQLQMAKRVASELENYINYNLSQIRQMVELNELEFDSPEKINERLVSQIMFNNNFDQIILLDGEGREFVHVHRYKVSDPDSFRSYASDIKYLFPKLNRTVFYGDVTFIKETGEPIINISFDLRNPQTDELIGVMIASLRLKPIWNLLANINVQPGQQIYILDSQYRLVAHPNPSVALKDIIYSLPSGEIAKGLMGNDVFMEYSRVHFGNQFFTVVSEHDLKEAFRLHRNISTVIFSVVASTIMMSALLIGFYIRHIVNPINHLSKVAKEIEGGNLELSAKVFSKDEIGAMAQAFNKMTKKLKDNNIQLKEFNIGLQDKIKREIEKTRRMEQLLFEQKKFADMGQMINAIAHQWRQPLNNIGLIQQYLYNGFVNGDITVKEYKEYSNSLMEIVQNMSATIDDFRTFFATEKLKERFNVISAIVDFLKLTSAQLNSNNINYKIRCFCCEKKHTFDFNSLHMECDSPELEVMGHSGEFKQVLQNIVANAKDAFQENHTERPMIDIYVKIDKSSVEIIFRDNAGGIAEDILPNIFDPYFTTKEEGKGTGIGLYISKVIIDDHFSGRLYARNSKDGAEFVLSIPKADMQVSPLQHTKV